MLKQIVFYDHHISLGALRMGVAEMTRFGMDKEGFRALAGLIRDVVVKNARVAEKVKILRAGFLELRYCFSGKEYEELLQRLHGLI